MTRLSSSEARKLLAKPKKPKYRNKRVTVDGITFASKREAAYYGELKMREKAGEIGAVELQKRYVLAINGILIGTYTADFAFHDDKAKRYRVVDVKGFATREFQRTRRLMRAIHGIEVEVVR
jgi:hypothetical protein